MSQKNERLLNDALTLWSSTKVFKWIVSQNESPEDVYIAEELAKDKANENALVNLSLSGNPVVILYSLFTLSKMQSRNLLKLCDKFKNDSRIVKVRAENSVAERSVSNVAEMIKKNLVVNLIQDLENSFYVLLKKGKSKELTNKELIKEIEELIDANQDGVWQEIPAELKGNIDTFLGKLRMDVG
jgi:hypothetical protein